MTTSANATRPSGVQQPYGSQRLARAGVADAADLVELDLNALGFRFWMKPGVSKEPSPGSPDVREARRARLEVARDERLRRVVGVVRLEPLAPVGRHRRAVGGASGTSISTVKRPVDGRLGATPMYSDWVRAVSLPPSV